MNREIDVPVKLFCQKQNLTGEEIYVIQMTMEGMTTQEMAHRTYLTEYKIKKVINRAAWGVGGSRKRLMAHIYRLALKGENPRA